MRIHAYGQLPQRREGEEQVALTPLLRRLAGGEGHREREDVELEVQRQAHQRPSGLPREPGIETEEDSEKARSSLRNCSLACQKAEGVS